MLLHIKTREINDFINLDNVLGIEIDSREGRIFFVGVTGRDVWRYTVQEESPSSGVRLTREEFDSLVEFLENMGDVRKVVSPPKKGGE